MGISMKKKYIMKRKSNGYIGWYKVIIKLYGLNEIMATEVLKAVNTVLAKD
jgi:hypothetical protein